MRTHGLIFALNPTSSNIPISYGTLLVDPVPTSLLAPMPPPTKACAAPGNGTNLHPTRRTPAASFKKNMVLGIFAPIPQNVSFLL